MKEIKYFSSSWCAPCKAFGPIIDKIKESGVNVVKIDIDDDQAATAKYGIRSIPTLIFLNEGQEYKRYSGILPEQEILNIYNG